MNKYINEAEEMDNRQGCSQAQKVKTWQCHVNNKKTTNTLQADHN